MLWCACTVLPVNVSANVLILNSGHQGNVATDAVMDGIESTLTSREMSPVYWVEYLDEIRFPGLRYERLFAENLHSKYRQREPEVIIATGNAAVSFALTYRERLFPLAPIVFASVDAGTAQRLSGVERLTGVVEAEGYRATLDLAFRLRPETDRIVFVTPGLLNHQLIGPLVPDYRPTVALSFIVADDLPSVKSELAALNSRAVVIPLAPPLLDTERPRLPFDRFVEEIAAMSPAPVYSVWDYLLGKGIVGGFLVSGAAHGREAASMALGILQGRSVTQMPFVAGTADRLAVDFAALQRHGLVENDLPEGTIVVNRPISFLAGHKTLVISTSVAFFVLSVFVVALLISIFRRRRAEAELRDSEEKYRQIFSTESDAIVLFAADTGQILDVNDAALELYGYRRSELLSMTAPELSAEPHKSSAFVEEVRERRFGTVTFRRHRGRDGGVFPVDISMSAFELQGQEVVGAVVRGITDRLAAEQALRDSEQRFHDFADSASDWYWEMDENLRFSAFSERFSEIAGVPQEELLGKTREETGIPGVDRRNWQRHLADVQARRPFRNFVHPRTLPGGETVYLSINGQPVHRSDGTFLGYRGTGSDVTELKNAEDELRSYRYHLEELVTARTSALEASNRELQSFSYSVSHDLRSPLRAIDGFSYALLEDYTELFDDRARDYLNRVRNASQRMGQLIDDMLELSRLTRRKLRRDTVDLTGMAAQINEQLQASNSDRSMDVVIQPDLACFCDSRMLRIALENLFDNAWKYTAQKPRGQIEFGCRERDGREIYYLRDNGVGFDMRYVDKLFGEFQRLHDDTEFTGTGIGLATVSRVVHRHGGEVWAEGILGEGATFSFTLGEVDPLTATVQETAKSQPLPVRRKEEHH